MQHFEREKTAKSNTVEILWNILNILMAGGDIFLRSEVGRSREPESILEEGDHE